MCVAWSRSQAQYLVISILLLQTRAATFNFLKAIAKIIKHAKCNFECSFITAKNYGLKEDYMKVRKIDLFSAWQECVALSLSMLIICVTVDDSTVLLVTSQLTSTQGLSEKLSVICQ